MSKLIQPSQGIWVPSGGRQRAAIDVKHQGTKINVYDWCSPVAGYDNSANLLEADAYCAARGLSLYIPAVVNGEWQALNVVEPVTLTSSRIVGDGYNVDGGHIGSQIQYSPLNPYLESIGVTLGNSENTEVEDLSFVCSVSGVTPSLLCTSGKVPAWGTDSTESTAWIDSTLWYQNSIPQLKSIAPGASVLQTTGPAHLRNVYTAYSKFGFINASTGGHVYVEYCSFAGAIAGYRITINGQDHAILYSGLQGVLASLMMGNTNFVNVLGGYTGIVERTHFYGSPYCILQVQDGAAPDYNPGGQSMTGFCAPMRNCSAELISEMLIWENASAIHDGFFENLNYGYANDATATLILPTALQYPGGHGKVAMELGMLQQCWSDKVIGPQFPALGNVGTAALKFSGQYPSDVNGPAATVDLDNFTQYGIIAPTSSSYGFTTVTLETQVISWEKAHKGDLSVTRGIRTVGNLIANPELGAILGSPSSHTNTLATAGNWQLGSAIAITCNTLAGWRTAGVNLSISEAMSRLMPVGTPIFQLINSGPGGTVNANVNISATAGAEAQQGRSFNFSCLSTSGLQFVPRDSTSTGYWGGGGGIGNDGPALQLNRVYAKYGTSTYPFGVLLIECAASSTNYVACLMGCYGEEAPYNPYNTPYASSPLVTQGPTLNPGTVVATPTTGQTVTIAQTTALQVCAPTATLAALTVAFPTPVGDGHTFKLVIGKSITALTLTPTTGQTITGGTATVTNYSATEWRFVLANNTWYQVA